MSEKLNELMATQEEPTRRHVLKRALAVLGASVALVSASSVLAAEDTGEKKKKKKKKKGG